MVGVIEEECRMVITGKETKSQFSGGQQRMDDDSLSIFNAIKMYT